MALPLGLNPSCVCLVCQMWNFLKHTIATSAINVVTGPVKTVVVFRKNPDLRADADALLRVAAACSASSFSCLYYCLSLVLVAYWDPDQERKTSVAIPLHESICQLFSKQLQESFHFQSSKFSKPVIASKRYTLSFDRLGRRFFFLQAGVQMLVSQVVVAVILGVKFGGTKELDKVYAVIVVIVVIVICCYVSAFAWSWGPLGWLAPSEIFPLEMRSAGQAITVAVNLFFTFVIAQAFLSMMCHMKFGIFLFFAAWVAIMLVFVYWFIPETKNVPSEE
ncbi:hypothetical protein SELMODRAFT_428805 [Selaginella moellendorffii]|uniref:Uncharacterized protein MST3-2 n=1 Tax=Selaginella moellendorffii TaxID=88036 RepID=D8T421_SELML|nr:hypothetical protein SELMODRAFT_428805 [Selaginella moellendorffii]